MLLDLLDFKKSGSSRVDFPEENPSAGTIGDCHLLSKSGNRPIPIVNRRWVS
jgi:hypothetical protein